MIPAMLSAIGVSLSEFADSMIVGNLIGPEAFAIVNLGLPIVLIASTIYTITGVGGSLLYAEYLGKKDKKRARETISG
jgi:Na+-driven multidrug efflux pump